LFFAAPYAKLESFFSSKLGRKPYLIIGKAEISSASSGLNPLGGFPWGTVQFGFPYRIVDTAACLFME